MNFYIGDRVKYNFSFGIMAGKIISIRSTNILIEFDQKIKGGHNGAFNGAEGKGKPGYCWWVYDYDMGLMPIGHTVKTYGITKFWNQIERKENGLLTY